MILFNINLVLQSELSPEKRKRPSRPPRMRSGWLFDEVDVTGNTEECGTKEEELGDKQQYGVINVACGRQQQCHC